MALGGEAMEVLEYGSADSSGGRLWGDYGTVRDELVKHPRVVGVPPPLLLLEPQAISRIRMEKTIGAMRAEVQPRVTMKVLQERHKLFDELKGIHTRSGRCVFGVSPVCNSIRSGST
jgi:hypothetical protein